MKNLISIILLYSILCFSCKKKLQNESDVEEIVHTNSVSFEKIDSIKIDYIGSPTVHDLDPKNRIFVLMEHKESSQIITVSSFDGQFLSSFSKWGDQPDNYGKLLASLKIIDNNSFLALGTRGLFEYSIEGTLKSFVKFSEASVFSFSIGMGKGLVSLNGGFIVENLEFTPKLNTGKEYYSSIRPLLFISPINKSMIPILKIPDTSIFLSGKWFFNNAWHPEYTVVGDQIIMAFGLEPKLYFFSTIEPYALTNELSLDLPEYKFFKGADEFSSEINFIGQARTSGRILNVKKLNDYLIVSYFPGFDTFDKDNSFADKSPGAAIEFWNQMNKKYPSRIAILDTLGNVLNDFVPEGLEPSSMLLRDGQLWMMEKPNEEEERDYFRLFRVGLKFGNK